MWEKLSLIIPVLNEEKNIYPLTKKIIHNIKRIKYEIIFVDDNSFDNTKKKLRELKKKYRFFKPIFRNKKRDLTQSCFDGIKKSRYDNILIMDGDLQHNPKYINKMYKIFNTGKYDIVIGSRNLLSGKNKGLSESRRFASIILIYLFRVFKIKTNDPMSGFFLFKKKIFLDNKGNLYGKGFKILVDFLLNSKKRLRTKDMTINFDRRHNSTSKMNFFILLILIRFYLQSLIKKILI